jgi:hypothetical protein
MFKTIGGIVGAIIVGVVTWWLTEGLRKPPPPEPPVKPPPSYSVTGTWTYTSRSSQRDAGCTRTIRLTMDGSLVAGVMEPCDTSKTGISGTLTGNTLELSRDTGFDTVQNLQLNKRSADLFIGKYWNVGKWPDEGTIELRR